MKKGPFLVFRKGDSTFYTAPGGPIGGLLELKISIKHEKHEN